ncbi:hypothetical protein EDC01DRAFT_630553 [Geopyxis carbonaria]|nr:hypothetical protein EDC01DRAFT_630553 [Geopyxis carbonaria]
MANITPIPAIPPHMRCFLSPRRDIDADRADTPSATPPITQEQRPDPPRLNQTSPPFAGTPPLITLDLGKPTLLDFFDPVGIVPFYSNLLEAMDCVCGTFIWMELEDFLLDKGFGIDFWAVVSANTSQHLGLRRAELLEKLTQGEIKSDMVGQVVEKWDFVWRLATWLTDGGEWEDVGPVRTLLQA